MKYRHEIDGLRAIAVVPVILFHAGLTLFSGGYVGVDVFFVISGYLITTIIINERAEGRFSILRFYERRARRILPALFLIMGLCVPFAWFWLPPEPFGDFLRSLTFAALFISNVHFWETTGYFQQAAELRPLLHTWSLAVEEQYYLFFPLLLALMGGFGRWKHIAVIGVLALMSLALSEWGWRSYPNENFFFTFSRMWELFVGSTCAFIAFKREVRGNGLLAGIGLGLIVYAIFFYDSSVPFPSIYTLTPVIGTALVLLYARQGTLVAWLLSTKLPVAIGLISYSAYLWHQPLFAFARVRSVHEPETWMMMSLGLASFVLAALSWRYVEQPFRVGPKRLLPGRSALFGASLAGIAAFVGFSVLGTEQNWSDTRIESRMTPFYQQVMDSTQKFKRPAHCLSNPFTDSVGDLVCPVFKGADAGETVAVFGDSHSRVILPSFEAYSRETGTKVVYAGKGGCPPIMGAYVYNGINEIGTCKALADIQARYVEEKNVSIVVLVARWSLYASEDESDLLASTHYLLNEAPAVQTHGAKGSREVFRKLLPKTVAYYQDLGAKVILIEPVPELPADPQDIIFDAAIRSLTPQEALQTFSSILAVAADHDRRNSFAASVFAGLEDVLIIPLHEAFRFGADFSWLVNGKSAYSDANHLSVYGASLLQQRISDALSQYLKR